MKHTLRNLTRPMAAKRVLNMMTGLVLLQVPTVCQHLMMESWLGMRFVMMQQLEMQTDVLISERELPAGNA